MGSNNYGERKEMSREKALEFFKSDELFIYYEASERVPDLPEIEEGFVGVVPGSKLRRELADDLQGFAVYWFGNAMWGLALKGGETTRFFIPKQEITKRDMGRGYSIPLLASK